MKNRRGKTELHTPLGLLEYYWIKAELNIYFSKSGWLKKVTAIFHFWHGTAKAVVKHSYNGTSFLFSIIKVVHLKPIYTWPKQLHHNLSLNFQIVADWQSEIFLYCRVHLNTRLCWHNKPKNALQPFAKF